MEKLEADLQYLRHVVPITRKLLCHARTLGVIHNWIVMLVNTVGMVLSAREKGICFRKSCAIKLVCIMPSAISKPRARTLSILPIRKKTL
mmetsp:Transcript_18936/g.35276  ORF Transcript_18936/g.35276 Transcript_18936/m.35276 type:complete len:90 (+) Transcript_18936:1769-2038(+)